MPSISIDPFQKKERNFIYLSILYIYQKYKFWKSSEFFWDYQFDSYDRLHSLFLSVWLQGTTNGSPNWMSTCLKVSDPCQGIGQHWKPCIAMRVPYFQRLPQGSYCCDQQSKPTNPGGNPGLCRLRCRHIFRIIMDSFNGTRYPLPGPSTCYPFQELAMLTKLSRRNMAHSYKVSTTDNKKQQN